MKKFLAVLLAVLTVLSCGAMAVYAEEGVTEVEESTEPAVNYNSYEICEDADFLTLYYVSTGNAKATILQPGDKVTTYKTTGKRNSGVTVLYYPDADAVYTGEWVPGDESNLAFSPSAVEFFRDEDAKYDGLEATIQPLDYTDYTIAYSDDNTFLGWAVFEFIPSSNTIKVCGVWDKAKQESGEDEVDDLYFIVDFFYSLRKALFAPIFAKLKYMANAFYATIKSIYDKIVVPKDVA